MIYGLLGKKLSYSYSPKIHERLGSIPYELMERSEEEVPSFLIEKNFKGVNVTIPYKSFVMNYLDELDESAIKVDCVNTIQNTKGRLKGYNTDYMGFLYSFKKLGLSDKKILIVGNGATAKTVKVALTDEGFGDIKIVSRRGAHNFEDIDYYRGSQVLINATPVGMYPNVDTDFPVDIDRLKNLLAVMDLNYNPLETKILSKAKSLGLLTMSGLLMLVAQAKYSSEIFQDKKIDDGKIEIIYEELIKDL
ncbi:MAG: shikimate dehydrogenase [Tissierellia bacterium]|nr:shikimate dehydrogenase [Tissierellia bacterium]